MEQTSQKPPKRRKQEAGLHSTESKRIHRLNAVKALRLFTRRKKMLETFYMGLLNWKAVEIIAEEFDVSKDAVWKDWQNRERWEPLIWQQQEAHEDGKRLLRQFQMGRETSLKLLKDPGVDPRSRVNAVRAFNETLKLEIELSQSLGLMPRVKLEHQVKLDADVTNKHEVRVDQTLKLLAAYEFLFSKEAPEGNIQADDSGEPVDKVEAADNP